LLLERAGHACLVCDGASAAAAESSAAAGVLLYTDSALQDPDIDALLAALRHQPPWSDIPSIVLCRTGPQSPVASHILQSIPNVTLLERPTSCRTLVSTIRAALRDRERQYRMRDQFVALHDSEAALKSASSALAQSN
jgi:DNA-binding NtrC family response regulator